MAEARLQVDPLHEPGLTPVATPVDTFARPNAGIGLAQVAQGLAQFAPSLARFTQGYNEDKQTEGEAAARRLHEAGKTYAQAAKEGLIPRHENPFFMAGFKEQWGRVTADTFQSDLEAAVGSNDNLQNSTDMKDFDQFVTKFRGDWLDKNVDPNKRDKFFETGFGKRADAYYSNQREDYARQLGVRVQKMADDAHFQEAKEHVYNYAGKAPASVIAGDLDGLSTDLILQGRDPTKVNHATADAIVAAALQKAQEGDSSALKYLDIMKQVGAGSGLLSDTKYGSAALAKGREDVSNLLWQANERETTVANQKRQARVRDTYTGVVQALASDRHADLTPFISKVADDPQAVGQLVDLQRNVNSLTFHTDEETKNDLFSRIWNDGNVTPQSVTAWLAVGKLTAQDSAWLISQISDAESLKKKAREGKSEFDDFQFKQTLTSIDHQFNVGGAVFNEADASRARYAKALLMNAWVKHVASPEGAKESDEARGLYLSKTAERIVTFERNGYTTKAPQPNFDIVNVDPLKTPILSLDGARQLRDQLKQQRLDPSTARMLSAYGITSPEQIAAFLTAQLGFLTPQTTPKK